MRFYQVKEYMKKDYAVINAKASAIEASKTMIKKGLSCINILRKSVIVKKT